MTKLFNVKVLKYEIIFKTKFPFPSYVIIPNQKFYIMNLPHINTQSEQSIIHSFESIARELIRNQKIQVNNCKFSFIDLEFYLYDDQHKELYMEDHVSRPFGELEIHSNGVDISLGNDHGFYGGIFIRRLYDEQNDCIISKSKVIRALFNKMTLGKNDIRIIEEVTPWKEIFMTIRKKPGSTDELHKTAYTQKRYRFMAKDQDIFKNVVAKKALSNTPIWRIKKLETI